MQTAAAAQHRHNPLGQISHFPTWIRPAAPQAEAAGEINYVTNRQSCSAQDHINILYLFAKPHCSIALHRHRNWIEAEARRQR